MGVLAFFSSLYGRIRRRDCVGFALALVAFYGLALQPTSSGYGGYYTHPISYLQSWASNDIGFIGLVILQIATLCVVVKRLHDRDLTGFYALVLLVPVLGWAWLAYELLVREGTNGANRFGPSPKAGYRTL